MVRHRYLDSAFGQPNVRTFLIGRCEAQPFSVHLQLSSRQDHAAVSRQLQLWVMLKMKRSDSRQWPTGEMALYGLADRVGQFCKCFGLGRETAAGRIVP